MSAQHRFQLKPEPADTPKLKHGHGYNIAYIFLYDKFYVLFADYEVRQTLQSS